MEEQQQLNSLAVSHLLQHTLRSLCIHENSQWVYAVFWRILPRNYPPPKWDGQGGVYDRSRGVRRNWILVWEDGFCNFAASAGEMNGGESSSSAYANCEYQPYQGLQPELFFKMSHEIYNYGEGLIGKVAADQSHKWIHKEPNDQEINFLSAWHNSADSHPRTWEAQFQSGIKTIALIAVREGVIQLGAVHKVVEDLSYVVLLRKKLSYIESIPGVLLPHPSSSSCYPPPNAYGGAPQAEAAWHYQNMNFMPQHHDQYYQYHHFANHNQSEGGMRVVAPSMSSLEALLSKLPSVVPHPHSPPTRAMELMGPENTDRDTDRVAKEEDFEEQENDVMAPPYHHHRHHYAYHPDLNVTTTTTTSSINNGGS